MHASSALLTCILPYVHPEIVTRTVTNCQISVTFGIGVVFFALALKEMVILLKRPLDMERGCKQPGSLKLILVANSKSGKDATKTGYFPFSMGNIDRPSCLEKVEHPYESRIRHQYQCGGVPLIVLVQATTYAPAMFFSRAPSVRP